MAQLRSIRSFARFVSLAACVAGTGFALRDVDPAEACGGWSEPSLDDLVTFDASLADAPTNLQLNQSLPGFPESCTDCEAKALLADWRGYLHDAGVSDADWEQILFKASGVELEALAKGKPPAGYEKTSLFKIKDKDRLGRILALVSLARAVEPLATFSTMDPNGGQVTTTTPPPTQLLDEAKAGMKTKDAFLAQRFAFQAVRILFYRKDWAGVVGFFEKTPALSAPSAHLAWSARYYYAGALRRSGKPAKANLELAHINANYAPLAESAENDFHPKEDGDWHESLKLAKDARAKTELWRAVGIKLDGVVAMQAIVALDPKSDMLALLMVRELNRAESLGEVTWTNSDPKDVPNRRKKTYTTLEKLALSIAATPGADRPWLMELVAGHIAAKRGDVGAARTHLGNAVAARKGDIRVASQAKASLALALAQDWKINPQREDELAHAMREIDQKFGQSYSVSRTVRGRLAAAYFKAGRIVDAEFLTPGTIDPYDPDTGQRVGKGKPKWQDQAFIKEMLARLDKTTTEFDKFVVTGNPNTPFTRPQLSQELALRQVYDGDFATASKTFQTMKATSEQLHTDPFINHVVDCHDCDHEKYANAPWTHASLTARLGELQKAANGTGEPAAEAALALGTALYNITWYGNARTFTENTHQSSRDTRAAERWFKRAFDLSAKRELKAKAAWYAAKAELATQINTAIDGGDDNARYQMESLPAPKTWFPVMRRFADTKYYKEVLRECGNFARWSSTQK